MEEDKSILIIDSEKSWLEFCQDILERNGYKVYPALTGQSVKELFISHPESKISLVILDIKSLEEDKTLISMLGQSEASDKRPVVIVFATGLTPDKARQAFRLGAYDCVNKPYDETSLLAFIEQTRADYQISAFKESYVPKGSHRILVIDDDYDWRTSLIKYLPLGDYGEEAANYETAVEKVLQSSPDLIVTDLRLKDNDGNNFEGLDLINIVRQRDKERGTFTPIIVVSAYSTSEHIRDCYRNFNISYFFDKRYLSPSKYRDSIKKALSYP